MPYGEILSIIVAVTWTITALCAEVASRRMGQLQMNFLRMAASLVILALILWVATGSPLPQGMGVSAILWLLASGVVGYVFGDYCLFSSYELAGSRFGQLFMTLAPVFSALAAWVLLGETLTAQALLGIVVTLSGIAIVVRKRKKKKVPESSPTAADGGTSTLTADSGASTPTAVNGSTSTPSLPKRRGPLPPKAYLFGIGAAMGQGFGIVLSKVGMGLCETTPLLPMAATMVRGVAGLIGFGIAYYLKGNRARMHEGLHDRTTMTAAAGAIITGPVIGVSLSLLAVQLAPAGIASTLMALTPVFILWPTRWLFHQPITARDLFGTLVAVLGVALFFL
ncbi:MAG: DMT family transporter [Bacteroidales bacterium]|nr:DMT family transporter [Bacteroidales bacterium]